MFNIPAPVMRIAGKAGNWLIKNGPKIMSVGGGAMAVGGAVMACNATLHADEVLDRHKQKMAVIEAAIASGDEEYTDKMIKHDKAVVYFETAVDFVKLYGPAFSVGMAGVGLMQGAFMITDRRRASAVAALATVDQMYQNLLEKVNDCPEIDITNEPTTKVFDKKEDGEEDPENYKIVLDPDAPNAFFFKFDADKEHFDNTFGNKKTEFLTNKRFIVNTIEWYNNLLGGHSITHLFVNDLLKSWGMDEDQTDIGQHYGWNAGAGDLIDYELVPFVKGSNGEDIRISMEEWDDLEATDIPSDYWIGIRLYSLSEGYDHRIDPRFIFNEVFG